MMTAALNSVFFPQVIVIIVAMALMALFFMMVIVKGYRRCPPHRLLVIYGKVGGDRPFRCLHNGGMFVFPIIQDYMYLSLEPMEITFSNGTLMVMIDPELPGCEAAAERLLGLREQQIAEIAARIADDRLSQAKDDNNFRQLLAEGLSEVGLKLVTLKQDTSGHS